MRKAEATTVHGHTNLVESSRRVISTITCWIILALNDAFYILCLKKLIKFQIARMTCIDTTIEVKKNIFIFLQSCQARKMLSRKLPDFWTMCHCTRSGLVKRLALVNQMNIDSNNIWYDRLGQWGHIWWQMFLKFHMIIHWRMRRFFN